MLYAELPTKIVQPNDGSAAFAESNGVVGEVQRAGRGVVMAVLRRRGIRCVERAATFDALKCGHVGCALCCAF